MTKAEKQNTIDYLLKQASKDKIYIKEYGPMKCRVISSTHSPIINIPKEVVNELFADRKIYLDGLIYKFC